MIAGFAISVAGLEFPSPVPLFSSLVGLVVSVLGAFVYYSGRR